MTEYAQLAPDGKEHLLEEAEKKTLCGRKASAYAMENRRGLPIYPVCAACETVRVRRRKEGRH